MLIQPYGPGEVRFAWCHRVYLRWRTHRSRRHPPLQNLHQGDLEEIGQRFDIRVLEHRTSETDVLLLLSLKPDEAVATCASKWKGQVSKWLRGKLELDQPADLLSRGYFATTTGDSTPHAVEQYLSRQGEHHGYADRPRPPVFVRRYGLTPADEDRLRAKHAHTLLQYHIVLATPWRKGVFSQAAGSAVAEHWRTLLSNEQAALAKVAFVPDHVHAAVRVHPAVSPANLVVRMMNGAQELMFAPFDESVIRAGVDRLWQPTAYLGSYGNLASPQVSKYLRGWESELGR